MPNKPNLAARQSRAKGSSLAVRLWNERRDYVRAARRGSSATTKARTAELVKSSELMTAPRIIAPGEA